VPYFHVVFTLPEKLRAVCRRNDREMYNLLFSAASQTLLRLGQDPKWLGGRLAFTAVLHTWTRELHYHPHLHCIVAAGALSEDQTRWICGSTRYLFPVAVLSALYRGLFLDGLKKLCERDEVRLDGQRLDALLESLYRQSWVVYIKRPFGGPEQVYRYLGRYTHRVGLSNQRLVSRDESGVCFATKGGKRITVSAEEFIRRFLLHVLPQGFTKTRHYGLLASGKAQQGLAVAQTLLQAEREVNAPRPPHPEVAAMQVESEAEPDEEIETEGEIQEDGEALAERILRLCGIDLIRCPACHAGRMSQQPLPPPLSPSIAGTDTS
jgi:hypothetical protein